MLHTEQSEIQAPMLTTDEVLARLPMGDYTDHYQPTYDNPQSLAEAIHEVQSTEPITTPRDVDTLQIRLTNLAQGEIDEPLIITGRCAEMVDINQPIDSLVQQNMTEISIVRSGVGKAIHVLRAMGQNTKPRSNETETQADGSIVPSYYGDAVNGQAISDRTPDPTRLVSAAVQARDLAAGIHEAAGQHVPAAHEALLMPYEMASMYVDPKYNRRYLLSADMPWIGKRTNALDGPHVEMLRGIENPIGVKIGADSTPEHIAGLQQRLNPDNVPGKLTFMIRIEHDKSDALEQVASALAEHAPNALFMYDLHAATRSVDGAKIRAVSDIIQETETVADTLHQAGLKLHGIHLETIMDSERLECVETPDQRPTHPGGVDPQLNPEQLASVLEGVKPHLLRPSKQELRMAAMSRRPLPAEVYEAAGLDPTPPSDLTPTQAIHRAAAYRNTLERIQEAQARTI